MRLIKIFRIIVVYCVKQNLEKLVAHCMNKEHKKQIFLLLKRNEILYKSLQMIKSIVPGLSWLIIFIFKESTADRNVKKSLKIFLLKCDLTNHIYG